jgi:hypothetical protein
MENGMQDRWVIAAAGRVADVEDPEGLHRIRAIIPDISEDYIHDEWIDVMMPWVGPDGYGPVHLPGLDTELLIFGRKGQKYTLFAIPIFNETHHPPTEFAEGARGLKTDSIYRLLADLLIQIKSAEQVDVAGPLVRLLGGDGEVVRVTPDKIGFHGAGGTARKALPPAATNLPSCIVLVNAIRDYLIEVGLCS